MHSGLRGKKGHPRDDALTWLNASDRGLSCEPFTEAAGETNADYRTRQKPEDMTCKLPTTPTGVARVCISGGAPIAEVVCRILIYDWSTNL